MNKNSPLLIIGAGSIGERHIRNLWNAGFSNLLVYRQRNLPFRNIGNAKVEVILDWNEAINKNPVAAFICTPTSQHIQQCINCIENNMHILVEKPLSHNLEKFDDLIQLVQTKNKLVHVAYMMRFHPLIKKIKNIIELRTYGKLISFHSHWGSYLPAWHPYEDYRNSYAARKEAGGGVALTLSHDIDLANWLADSVVVKYASEFNYSSALKIDVESVADFLIRYENGITGHVHLNYIEKKPHRNYQFYFEDATIDFNYFNDSMEIITEHESNQEKLPGFDKNTHFEEELKFFIDCIEEDTNHTLSAIQQIRESETIIKMCIQK